VIYWWFKVKAGIIGARGAGKSTVFHALTALAPLEGMGDSKNRARPGQIKVPDPRLDFLEETYGSKKKVPVELSVTDFAANPKELKPGSAIDPSLLPLIRDLEALLLVIPHFSGNSPDIRAAVEGLESELVFADFEQAERRVERLKKEKAPNDLERSTLDKCLKQLETGAPLRKLELSPQELQRISNFCFLSQKPALVVVNCDTEQAAASVEPALREVLDGRGLDVLNLSAAFEAELWELGPAEQNEMLAEAGIEAPARDRLISSLYKHLGLITFYTAGEPEAHAWSLTRGASPLEAAGKIHSDIAKGFIRAEVVSYADFAELKSDAKVKAAGKLRLEGKDYTMQDGDIIHIRFKV
jgi:GTP-binding protein YchF